MSAFDGSNNANPGAAGGASDLDDILSQMFGMNMGGMGGMPGMGGMGGMPGGGPGMRKPKKGPDEVQAYTVSLEDMYKGRSVKFASTKNVICSLCKGKGGKDKAHARTCGNCDGHGKHMPQYFHGRIKCANPRVQESSKCSNRSALA